MVHPPATPAAATSAPSVTNCRNRRRRPAPSAIRSPTSPARVLDRARTRPATFEQATSRIPTARLRRIPSGRAKACRNPETPDRPSNTASVIVRRRACSVGGRPVVARRDPLLLVTVERRLESGGQLRPRHAGSQPGDQAKRPERRVGKHVRVEGGDGAPEIDEGPGFDAAEAGASDAQNGLRASVEKQRLSDHRGCAAEPADPVVVTEHDAGPRRRNVVVGRGEQAARRRHDPEDVERIRRDELRDDRLGRSGAALHPDLGAVRIVEQSDPRGRRRRVLQCVVERIAEEVAVAGGCARLGGRTGGRECDQAVRLRHRQRPQHRGIDEGEDRSGGAGRQADGHDRRQREGRPSQEAAPCVPDVLHRGFQYGRRLD